jgi:hypothetical protein
MIRLRTRSAGFFGPCLQGVEQTTSEVPRGCERAFVVYRSDTSEALEGLACEVSKLGGQVRITPMAREVLPVAA